MNYFTHLYCPKCSNTYEKEKPVNLCKCGSPLLAEYDLEKAKNFVKESLQGRENNMWRYRELLPVVIPENIISLGEGFTPIFPFQRLGKMLGLENLFCKDEGLNPTGSFKARGAAAGISRIRELGIKEIAMPTAGNAGGAWASYGARAGIKTHIAMPVDAPEITKTECVVAGAEVYLVRGNIADAGKIIGEGAKKYDWFEVSTLKEPYRIEGKKTMGFEILEQMNWDPPDYIFYPTGGGVGIIGIWKAIKEMEEIGWIDGKKKPKMVSVQAEGCAPIVRAFEQGEKFATEWSEPETIAAGIRVPKALGDFLVLEAIRDSGGTALAVSDGEIKKAIEQIARLEGMFICPEGAANVVALEKLIDKGWLNPGEKVLLLNTGAGIKYSQILKYDFAILEKNDRL